MEIATDSQRIVITDPPNVEKLTQIVVNLQEMTVELTYQGHPALVYTPPASTDAASWSGSGDVR